MSTNVADFLVMEYATPWGWGRLSWRGDWLESHRLPGGGGQEAPAPRWAAASDSAAELLSRLERYFAGEAVGFNDLRLNLSHRWTGFAADVAAALAAVGYGEVISYGELARRAGHPRAQRAVGSFLARNPYPLILPCHRIVLSDGRLGNFSAGIDWKRRLLAIEGVSGF